MWPERDAVIFAGGGHKGFAYLGALEVLQRQQWNVIAGSSVGSLAALALAAQLPLQAVVDAANALPEFHRGSRGLLQTGGLRELVERALRTRFRTEITFAELHAKIHARLVVTATLRKHAAHALFRLRDDAARARRRRSLRIHGGAPALRATHVQRSTLR